MYWTCESIVRCEDITNIFKASRDPDELRHYWMEVYDKAGTVSKNDFEKYIWLITKAAKANSEFVTANQSLAINLNLPMKSIRL